MSSLAAGHLTLVPELKSELEALGRGDIVVVVGGVVPPQDFDALYEAGAAAIYPPGTVIADAAASRSPSDRDMAFERLRKNGVTIVSTEMLLYEWLERAGTDTFRAALPLLK